MNQELWNKIESFDFENPPDKYGFSTRLAGENFWTKEFTNQAILEYKKFMYLAATSDLMVSPSEIIDTVWHQHLIFTQSYQDFCNILGKQIQHVPSTHNKEDFEKFRLAKERTIRLYETGFGQQPKNIWTFTGMFESLNLEKAKHKLRAFIIWGILTFICLTAPAYFLLKPVYVHIDNPDFIFGLMVLTGLTFAALEFYNRITLKNIVNQFDETSFVYHLQPSELVYLKTHKLSDVINGTVNELIANRTIKVNSDNSIELTTTPTINNNAQYLVVSTLSELGQTFYPNLLNNLGGKSIFWNTPQSMDAFQKYFNKSKKFGFLFYANFIALTLLLLLSFTRIATGVLHEKPIVQIVLVTIALAVLIIRFLQRLTRQISETTIPGLYKNEILPARQAENDREWIYFLYGTSVLTASFIPLVEYIDRNNTNGSSCGTSCGSSCGSSCGGGCGGCGGGD